MTQSPMPGDRPPVEYPTGATTPGAPMGDTYAGEYAGETVVTSTTYGESGSQSTTDVAKDEASNVKDSAKQAGSQVAGTAKEQAGEVAGEARRQAKDLLHQSRSELQDQASQQQQRAASGLRGISQELQSMANSSSEPGVASDLAHQAGERVDAMASWLENREPGQLLDEVRGFARQRPMAFLGIAAAAGVLVGRLGRGLQAEVSGGSGNGTSSSTTTAVTPTTPSPTGIVPPAVPTGTAGTTGYGTGYGEVTGETYPTDPYGAETLVEDPLATGTTARPYGTQDTGGRA